VWDQTCQAGISRAKVPSWTPAGEHRVVEPVAGLVGIGDLRHAKAPEVKWFAAF
jgi:hypothetical protein